MVYMIALRKPDNNDELPVYFYPSSSSTTLSISSRSSLAHPSQIHAIPLLMIPLSRQSKTSSLMCLSFSFSRASYLSTHPPLVNVVLLIQRPYALHFDDDAGAQGLQMPCHITYYHHD